MAGYLGSSVADGRVSVATSRAGHDLPLRAHLSGPCRDLALISRRAIHDVHQRFACFESAQILDHLTDGGLRIGLGGDVRQDDDTRMPPVRVIGG